jgi:hypothetical protein
MSRFSNRAEILFSRRESPSRLRLDVLKNLYKQRRLSSSINTRLKGSSLIQKLE